MSETTPMEGGTMSQQYFHFTLGPVQGFVAQARRTQDLWSGSFLLSFLSVVAMKEAERQGAKILFPKPDEDFINILTKKNIQQNENVPKQGTIPNRFKAKVPSNFVPDKVIQAVQDAWCAIADTVYQSDLKHLEIFQSKHKALWDSQIKYFWDMVWALTPDFDDSSILDKRKNWRTHFRPIQYGTKCMIMEGYQELSCTLRPNSLEQKTFWKSLRKHIKSGKTDLKEGEVLCAIAYIKRRFARTFKQLSVMMPSGWQLTGWQVSNKVPSVQDIAAAHWIANVMTLAKSNPQVKQNLINFYKEASPFNIEKSETNILIECVKHVVNQRDSTLPKIHRLDGTVFFSTELENYPDMQSLHHALEQLYHSSECISPASPFYAILLMDGDSLGQYMSKPEYQDLISTALKKFTQKVPSIVLKNNGFLIYSGGDDVLALTPINDALTCANQLRLHYQECFNKTDIVTSLSGAIEYVHIKTPFMKGICDVHPLLDQIAKEQTGRNSLAIRLQKPGNQTAQWSQPWERAVEGDLIVLEEIANGFKQAEEHAPGFSSQFIYRLRDRYSQFQMDDLSDVEIKQLLLSDYYQLGCTQSEKADRLIQQLLSQMQPARYCTEGDSKQEIKTSKEIQIDAGLIARFLSHKGVE